MRASTQFYHPRDAIANLRVRVVVRKISAPTSSKQRDAISIPIGATWSACFAWHDANSGDARQTAAGAELRAFVDADAFAPSDANSQARLPSAASATTASDQAPAAWHNSMRLMRRLQREERCQRMHIALCLSDSREQLVLCVMQLVLHSQSLCMSPGFSPIADADDDVDAATKGPMLAPYRVAARDGSVFEYVLDNVADLVVPALTSQDAARLEQRQHEEQQHDAIKCAAITADDPAMAAATLRPTRASRATGWHMLVEILTLQGLPTTDAVAVACALERSPDAASKDHHGQDQDGLTNDMTSAAWQHTRPSLPVTTHDGTLCASFSSQHRFQVLRYRQAHARGDPSGSSSSAMTPGSIVFAVTAQDWWRRRRVLGYSELKIPVVPGMYERHLAFWSPLQTKDQALEAFFLGEEETAIHPCAAQHTSKALLSRLGVRAVSSPMQLRVRLHVVEVRATPHEDSDHTDKLARVSATLAQPRVVKRSVEEILRSVRVARRLRQSTEQLDAV